ncbi:uncharacterized protein LOC121504770 [Cheilinus undulatus]|uniref:uncharacterized protein LOC121504770 n=1 Tax=Cheilinus undulatus TaxID=241271 RepID=UPI001BD680FA|nr:uncharacterized protein LOC121504770 [Cheilinus undulatus]
MAITTLCAVMVALRVLPNRSQFFLYESISLSCGEQGICSHWMLKRNTSLRINQECLESKEGTNESDCSLDDLYPLDSGVYWCESAAGEYSESINITVTSGPVILESPALPVMEGDDVTLCCTNRTTITSSLSPDEYAASSSNLPADFYKDGLLIGSSSTGNMTIHSVNKSDEGLYKCNISGVGQSLDSWLSVRAGRPKELHTYRACTKFPVVVVCLMLMAVISAALFYLWRRYKGKVERDVPYTDVTITPGVQMNRLTGLDAVPTFYSSVKPGYT